MTTVPGHTRYTELVIEQDSGIGGGGGGGGWGGGESRTTYYKGLYDYHDEI